MLLVLFILTEIVLRQFLPSPNGPLVSAVTHDGVEWYQINRGYLRKYFPANSPSIPELRPALFRKVKSQNTYRIMCLGESSMFGTPYEMAATIPAIVRKQLRHQHPSMDIEVLNWGASAINSNVLNDLADNLLTFDPDLIMIYTGHNEFYGPEGVDASFVERMIPALIEWKYQFRETRLWGVLQPLFQGNGNGESETNAPNLMKQVSKGNLVKSNSEDAEWVYRQFENNMRRIIRKFGSHAIPVLISTVTSNLFFPPFVSDSLVILKGESDQLDSFLTEGKWDSLAEGASGILRRDSVNAIANYWLGRAMIAQGRVGEGMEYLARARDEDLLKFRAPGRINEILRGLTKEEGLPLLPVDSLISSRSQSKEVADAYFWEHLHLTAMGYYEIAIQFVSRVSLASVDRDGSTSVLPFDYRALSIPWLDLAYAERSIKHLTGRWPFHHYRRSLEVLESASEPLAAILEDVYRRSITWDEGCYRTAAYFWGRQSYADAEVTYNALIDVYPRNFYVHYLLGSLLNQTGRKEKAVGHYNASLGIRPDYPNPRIDLGLLHVNEGEFDKAVVYFKKALQSTGLSPSLRANALYGMAAAYANKNMSDSALALLDSSLTLLPNYSDAISLRRRIMEHARK